MLVTKSGFRKAWAPEYFSHLESICRYNKRVLHIVVWNFPSKRKRAEEEQMRFLPPPHPYSNTSDCAGTPAVKE